MVLVSLYKFLCFTGVGMFGYTVGTQQINIINVQSKLKDDKNGCITKLIITDNNGKLYKMQNSILYRNFNALENWNKIQIGENVIIKYYGWHIPFLKLLPNIIEIIPGNIYYEYGLYETFYLQLAEREQQEQQEQQKQKQM